MNTLNFLDANVWLALVWSRHVHAERARSWFEEAGEQRFIFCRFTQLTVLRLLTTEKIMGWTPSPCLRPGVCGTASGLMIAFLFWPNRRLSRRNSGRAHVCPPDLRRSGRMLTSWHSRQSQI